MYNTHKELYKGNSITINGVEYRLYCTKKEVINARLGIIETRYNLFRIVTNESAEQCRRLNITNGYFAALGHEEKMTKEYKYYLVKYLYGLGYSIYKISKQLYLPWQSVKLIINNLKRDKKI